MSDRWAVTGKAHDALAGARYAMHLDGNGASFDRLGPLVQTRKFLAERCRAAGSSNPRVHDLPLVVVESSCIWLGLVDTES